MPAAADPETVTALQERAAQAQPAEQVEIVDGWWLRHAPRSAWWIGTVLPHGAAEPEDELTRRVARAEEFYAERRTATRFQITPGACAAGLDGLLARRGYRREIPVSLCATRVADVLDRLGVDRTRVEIADRPTVAWIDAWSAVQGPGADPGAQRELLDRVERPSGYATALLEGEIVAVGRAVADTGWMGAFGMATLPRARSRGAASAVLAALSGWAADHRIDRAYLQVECGNAAAVRLYERAGFTELRRFHFRTRVVEPGS